MRNKYIDTIEIDFNTIEKYSVQLMFLHYKSTYYYCHCEVQINHQTFYIKKLREIKTLMSKLWKIECYAIKDFDDKFIEVESSETIQFIRDMVEEGCFTISENSSVIYSPLQLNIFIANEGLKVVKLKYPNIFENVQMRQFWKSLFENKKIQIALPVGLIYYYIDLIAIIFLSIILVLGANSIVSFLLFLVLFSFNSIQYLNLKKVLKIICLYFNVTKNEVSWENYSMYLFVKVSILLTVSSYILISYFL